MKLDTRKIKLLLSDKYPPLLYAENGEGLSLKLETELKDELFIYSVSIKNKTDTDITPDAIVLRLGIDTYMDTYPEWGDKLFPTTLRCERTHLWGYFSSPNGNVVGIGCDAPVASWRHMYNETRYSSGIYYGHRIYTTELLLLKNSNIPERHPAVNTVRSGEELEYKIIMFNCDSVEAYPEQLYKNTGIPFLGLDRCSIIGDESPKVQIVGYTNGNIRTDDDGSDGTHKIIANDGRFISEAIYHRRVTWSHYMSKAAEFALQKPQKATTHVESWLGLFSLILEQKYHLNEERKIAAEKAFDELFYLMYSRETKLPTVIPNRIQNTAYMVSLITDYCEAGVGNEEELLEIGNILADFLLCTQKDDGAYYNGKAHYTCVCYIAKSILEFAEYEKKYSDNEIFRERYERHYASAKRAIDDLVAHGDNIGTEGEATFEDGMISCSALQMAHFALTLPECERGRYIEAAEMMIQKHRCLEMNLIPDARMRGSTIRFWEPQYDVLKFGNFITADHGWTAWKNYALYYLYLLTGKEEYIAELFDSMGGCMQLVGDDLWWGFCVDPSITLEALVPDKEQPVYDDAYSYYTPQQTAYRGKKEIQSFGECYIPMISGWYRTQKSAPVNGGFLTCKLIMDGYRLDVDTQGGCCDNDVHEHFKCLEETVLGKIFVNVYGDRISVYGGKAKYSDGILEILGYDETYSVYINSEKPISFMFDGKLYSDRKGFVDLKNK